MSNIIGVPEYNIAIDHTDRIGIWTLGLSLFWQVPRWPLSIPEYDASKPTAPSAGGGLLLIDEDTKRDRGACLTTWMWEGIHGDGRSVTFRGRGNSLDYQFDPGFAQTDIALLPNIAALLKTYGGIISDGQIQFLQPTLNRSTTGSSGSQLTTGTPTKNPMFGQKDFLRLEGTYSHRYVATDLAAVTFGVGKIFESGNLPGRPPFYTGRNWLKLPIQYRRRGLIYEILEVYWLSGEGGWPRVIYAATGNNVTAGQLVSGDLGSLDPASQTGDNPFTQGAATARSGVIPGFAGAFTQGPGGSFDNLFGTGSVASGAAFGAGAGAAGAITGAGIL